MSRERLAQLMQAHQEAMEADHNDAHQIILRVLRELEEGTPYEEALHFLNYMATMLTHRSPNAELYRQAAAQIRQMQQEEP
jgi:hypothetical protein